MVRLYHVFSIFASARVEWRVIYQTALYFVVFLVVVVLQCSNLKDYRIG